MNRKGQAYFMVLIATMAMFVSISAVLIITINSRNTTGRYADFIGRYDLAIAGNEQALFLLRQGFDTNRDSIINQVYMQILTAADPLAEDKDAALTAAALPVMQANLLPYFDGYMFNDYRRIWNFEVSFEMADDLLMQDKFHATTTIETNPSGVGILRVNTVIARYIGKTRGHPIDVRAYITWQHPGCICTNLSDIANCLDYYTLAMVELLRLSN